MFLLKFYHDIYFIQFWKRKGKKERKFYNQNFKQTYSVVFHFRNMVKIDYKIKHNSK